MSKAFTREDGAAEPALKRPPVRLADGETRYMTREGFAARSRALKDLEAIAGASPEEKDRAQHLRALLDVVTVPDASVEPSGPSQVVFGAWVEVEDEDGQRARYRLVGPDEVDVPAGHISVESPIARSLLGRTVGETVVLNRPRGAREVTVIAIAAEPERSGDPDPGRNDAGSLH